LRNKKGKITKKKAKEILEQLDTTYLDFINDTYALPIATSSIAKLKCVLNEKDWKEYFEDAVRYAKEAKEEENLRLAGIIKDLISTKNPEALDIALKLSEELIKQPEIKEDEYAFGACIYALVAGNRRDNAKKALKDKEIKDSYIAEDLISYLIKNDDLGYAKWFSEMYIEDGYTIFVKVYSRYLAEKGEIQESLDYANNLGEKDRVDLWLDIFPFVYRQFPIHSYDILMKAMEVAKKRNMYIWYRIFEKLLEVDEVFFAYNMLQNLGEKEYYDVLSELYCYLKIKGCAEAENVFKDITRAYRTGKISYEDYFPVIFLKECLEGGITSDTLEKYLNPDLSLDCLQHIYIKLCKAGKFEEAVYSLDTLADDFTGYVYDVDIAYLIDIVADELIEKLKV
jgi:hypothetical protein